MWDHVWRDVDSRGSHVRLIGDDQIYNFYFYFFGKKKVMQNGGVGLDKIRAKVGQKLPIKCSQI